MFTLSVRRQEYLNESSILWTYVFGHMPNSNQARICVLGFSANRMYLVSRFYVVYIFFTLLQSVIVLKTNCAVRCSPMFDAVISKSLFHCKKLRTVLRSNDALQLLG